MTGLPIAVTIGEPAGVGPELAQKAWDAIGQDVPFFVIGDPRHFDNASGVQKISAPSDALTCRDLPVLPLEFLGEAIPGQPDARNAQGVIDAIALAVDLVGTGAASAVTTLPIHKKALKDGADFPFPGHTEYLAHLAGVEDVVMMLACPELRVVPATIHIPLSEVPKKLNASHLRKTIEITEKALRRDFSIDEPRIAITGLNPHAGEGGAMGHEERDLMSPLITQMIGEGFRLSGPHSADTMFHARARRGYDAAICMYHDQALIPIKTIDFASGVNVTLGLPFVRTSPDHGTAFDIAGKGLADPTSFIEALRLAQSLAENRRG